MTTYLSKELREGMDAARLAGMKKASRLRVLADDAFHPVLRLWRDGFSVEEAEAAHLRGLVDLYDGSRHLYQCLIVAAEEDGGEMRFEFKRNTPASDRAPLDYSRDPDAPVALLPRPD
ncbi:hypothetical protein [Antarcticimicrobium luteum]|uniref:Uncharacterized protein n=1 Tax=Antarcticimicrobium luteum TaxID=2547397 RepID=A0A4R5V4U3_9RHOB|nr:hypothetical protein [Antarcticimicrobium luteum]TDK46761.1 hypothetical protein E1832_11710 [Antarcticimicrobium luteum]